MNKEIKLWMEDLLLSVLLFINFLLFTVISTIAYYYIKAFFSESLFSKKILFISLIIIFYNLLIGLILLEIKLTKRDLLKKIVR